MCDQTVQMVGALTNAQRLISDVRQSLAQSDQSLDYLLSWHSDNLKTLVTDVVDRRMNKTINITGV